MKKLFQIFTFTALFVSLVGCAPKTNQKPSNSDENTSPSSHHAVYESFSLYFPNIDKNQITKEDHEIRIQENASQEKLILDALKMGSKNNNLISPLAADAKFNSIKTVSGLCTIDCSDNFLNITSETNDNAELALSAIVQSLCELDTVQQVKFNINGNTAATINDIDLSQPISPTTTNL